MLMTKHLRAILAVGLPSLRCTVQELSRSLCSESKDVSRTPDAAGPWLSGKGLRLSPEGKIGLVDWD